MAFCAFLVVDTSHQFVVEQEFLFELWSKLQILEKNDLALCLLWRIVPLHQDLSTRHLFFNAAEGPADTMFIVLSHVLFVNFKYRLSYCYEAFWKLLWNKKLCHFRRLKGLGSFTSRKQATMARGVNQFKFNSNCARHKPSRHFSLSIDFRSSR